MPRRKTVPLAVHKTGIVTLKIELRIPNTMPLDVDHLQEIGGVWQSIAQGDLRTLIDLIDRLYCDPNKQPEPTGKLFFRFEDND